MSALRNLRNVAVLVILAVAVLGAPRSAVATKHPASCFRVNAYLCAHDCGAYVCKIVYGSGGGAAYFCCPPTK